MLVSKDEVRQELIKLYKEGSNKAINTILTLNLCKDTTFANEIVDTGYFLQLVKLNLGNFEILLKYLFPHVKYENIIQSEKLMSILSNEQLEQIKAVSLK